MKSRVESVGSCVSKGSIEYEERLSPLFECEIVIHIASYQLTFEVGASSRLSIVIHD